MSSAEMSSPPHDGGETRLPPNVLPSRDVASALVSIGNLIGVAGLPAPIAVHTDRDDHVGILVHPDDFGAWHIALAAHEPGATRGLVEPDVRLKASASVDGVRLVLESVGPRPTLVDAMRSCFGATTRRSTDRDRG